MPDAPTPLDLDAIRADLDARVPARDLDDRNHARALIAEVEHLRSGVQTIIREQNDLHDFEAEGLRKERHDALAEVERLRAEVARLTTRPAPVWDEAGMAEAVRGDLEAAGILPWTNGGARIVGTVVDAMLDLLPGRSEAEVKAEALRGFATAALAQFAADGNGPEDTITVTPAFIAGIANARAARLSAEGGAS